MMGEIARKCWVGLIARIRCDSIILHLFLIGMSLKGLTNEQKLKHVSDLSRSDEWIEAAIRKVIPLLDSITVLVGNPEETVRLELAKLSSELIQKSSRLNHYLYLLYIFNYKTYTF